MLRLQHGFVSEKLWVGIERACGRAFRAPGSIDGARCDFQGNCPVECEALLTTARDLIGDIDQYNVLDQCASVECPSMNLADWWLRLPAVRAALHVSPNVSPDFTGARYRFWAAGANNTGWNYNQSREKLLPALPKIMKGVRTLIYSGDLDSCVPYIWTERWTSFLASRENFTTLSAWGAWTVDEMVAGYATRYRASGGGGNVTFSTVKAAGHMVPQTQPKRALELFRSFIGGTPPLFG